MEEQLVRIRFNRADEPKVDFYEVHRQLGNGASERIMKIQQSREPNLIAVKEAPIRDEFTGNRFVVSQRRILEDSPITVWVDGEVVPEEEYILNRKKGWVYFHKRTGRMEDEVVEVSYNFDGYEVFDGHGMNGDLVNYYGPEAVDLRTPAAPRSLYMYPDGEKLRFYFESESLEGQEFIYTVTAHSNDGSYSIVRSKTSVVLGGGVHRYILEKDAGNGAWAEVKTGDGLYDTKYDTQPPEGLSGFKSETSTREDGKIEVHFSWLTPLRNEKSNLSARYRLRIQALNGNVSEPSGAVGPEQVKSNLEKVVVLRAQGSAIPPVYGDKNAVVVQEVTDLSAASVADTVDPNASYAYSAFVVDAAGNASIARTAVITV